MHRFWQSQPIQTNFDISENNFIKNNDEMKNIYKQEPYKLPDGFYWYNFDLQDDKDMNEIYNFLLNNYTESDDNTMRIHYSKELIKWSLLLPFNKKDFNIGIYHKQKLIGTIFGVPIKINSFGKEIITLDINFLCVNKMYRDKRLSPVLIKEISRRAVYNNIYTGYYTTYLDLPNKLSTCNYYQKPLNVKKLLDIDYMDNPKRIPEKLFIRKYKILSNTTINIRKIEKKDLQECYNKFNLYNKQYKLYPIYTIDEFEYKFMNNDLTLVVENNNKITDFISYFYVPFQILDNNKIKEIKKAYIYYYFNNETELKILFDNSYVFLEKDDIDVISCLDQMNNSYIFDNTYHKTEGILNYHLFNWNLPKINKNEIGMITI